MKRSTGIWLMVWCALAAVTLLSPDRAMAQSVPSGSMKLSSVAKTDAATHGREDSTIERVLSVALRAPSSAGTVARSFPFLLPVRPDRRVFKTGLDPMPGAWADSIRLGSISGESSRLPRTRLASLGPMAPGISKRAAGLMDSFDLVSSAGSLVRDPSTVFSAFEIIVDRTAYTLDLYGMKDSGKKTVLYSCRVGLGSPDFPTPRGTFYVLRIFDDKPLWIPPPRWWAWGQVATNSVYGGHMLPLFEKIPDTSDRKTSDTITSLDNISPRMKMVDGGMYRVHGTDAPWSVGSGQSHGCVRMLNSSVKRLADTLKMYVGQTERGQTANGPFVGLTRPVKVMLVN